VDGFVGRTTDGTFAKIRAGAGETHDDSYGAGVTAMLMGAATPNIYKEMYRAIYLFDTSNLGNGATIISAVLSLYPAGDKVGSLGKTDCVLTSSNPASNVDLVNGDYSNVGDTVFTRITYDNWSNSAYNDFVLDATGIANITKTGISKFGTKFGWDIDNSTVGLIWGSGRILTFYTYKADNGGTTVDPKLVITYTPLLGVNPAFGSHNAMIY